MKHSIESRHRIIIERNVTGISNGFSNNTMNRRIAESLITMQKISTLNNK